MPAKHRIGNIATECDRGIIVHQVNAQGCMGSGVAKALMDQYPQMYKDYQDVLGAPYTQKDSGRDFLGQVIFTDIRTGLWICSLVGQQFFGREKKRYTSYDALDVGFSRVATMAKVHALPVHYPLIGSGLGGADWSIVALIIEKNLVSVDHTLWELPQA